MLWRKLGFLQVEVTTRCQLRCVMCPKAHFKWRNIDMDLELFKKLPLAKFKYVHLQGWGEPLLNPRIAEMIEIAKRRCKVGLTTNGLLLEEHIDEMLKLDLVAVSIADARSEVHARIRGCDLEAITNGIAELSSKRCGKKPRIVITTIMLRDTIQSLPDIVELAKRCGADEVIANNLDYIPSPQLVGREVFDSQDAIILDFVRLAAKKAKKLGVNFVSRPLRMEEALVCAENPIKNCFVTADGMVAPCVYLHLPTDGKKIVRYFKGKRFEVEKLYFGSAENFDSVWKNRRYVEFREIFEKRLRALHGIAEIPELPEVCRTCYKAYSV